LYSSVKKNEILIKI